MAPEELPEPLLSPSLAKILGWGVVFILLVVGAFNFPLMPGTDLDPSWRMALGYFFERGMQFGHDVVFTYGPLGFVMGKTFSGLQFGGLIAGQLILAVISAIVIAILGSRLRGSQRVIYFTFFILFGITYEDALHMLVIVLFGFELIRLMEAPRWGWLVLIAAVLAFYAQIKFTDFLLICVALGVSGSYGLWRRQPKAVAVLGLASLGFFLGLWVCFGQKISNLPAYFAASWQISQGYQWAMAIPSPLGPLWKGLVVLSVLIAYAVVHLWLNPDKPRALANTVLLGAFAYLNWKHGFVRADGHMIGFFFCALLPLVAYPALLNDPPRFRLAHRWVFIVTIAIALWGLENTIWGVVRRSLGAFQDRTWNNIESAFQWSETRQRYSDALAKARLATDMYMTRELAGGATLDVLGFEQGVAILNRFNYRPRPVIQSYSTFTPALAKLNRDFFKSADAPKYVLSKIQAIDHRLPSMDDPYVLLLLAYRYEFLRTEKDFGLWKLNSAPFDAAAFEPRLLRTTHMEVNHPLSIEDVSDKPLWLQIDLQPSLLGKIRSFLYKPPHVILHIETTKNEQHDYLMPLPVGRTGFIINPLIEDVVDYMHFANSQPAKLVRSIALRIPDTQLKFFASTAAVELSTMPSPTSGKRFFAGEIEHLLHMFQSFPIRYTSRTPVSESTIDGREVAVLHAPSQMVFDVPPGAKFVTGKFGMLSGTYTNGGNTDGALFLVYWSNGSERRELFRRYLDPVNQEADRRLQDFSGNITGLNGGRVYLEVQNGPNDNPSWDWSAWSNIKIE
jgi:hypothetical protein